MAVQPNQETTSYVIDDQPQFPTNRVKLGVFGAEKVGKSSLICRLATGTVHQLEEAPPQRRAVQKLLGSVKLKVELVEFDCSSLCVVKASADETATAARSSLPVREFVDMNAAFLLYDTTLAPTFEGIVRALAALQSLLPPDCDICLLGTKSDVRDSRQVSFFQAENVAKHLGLSLFETSAHSGVNCEEALHEVLERHVERRAEADEYVYESMGIINDQKPTPEARSPHYFCGLPFWPFSRSVLPSS